MSSARLVTVSPTLTVRINGPTRARSATSYLSLPSSSSRRPPHRSPTRSLHPQAIRLYPERTRSSCRHAPSASSCSTRASRDWSRSCVSTITTASACSNGATRGQSMTAPLPFLGAGEAEMAMTFLRYAVSYLDARSADRPTRANAATRSRPRPASPSAPPARAHRTSGSASFVATSVGA